MEHVVNKLYVKKKKGQMAGSCECGNEPLGFIKFWKFCNWL